MYLLQNVCRIPGESRGCSYILWLLAFCCMIRVPQMIFPRTANHIALKQTTIFSYRVLKNPRLWKQHNTSKEHSNHFVDSSSLAKSGSSKLRGTGTLWSKENSHTNTYLKKRKKPRLKQTKTNCGSYCCVGKHTLFFAIYIMKYNPSPVHHSKS